MSFLQLIEPHVFKVFVLFVGWRLNCLKRSLSLVPKHKETDDHREKIGVLGKLHSGLSYNALAHVVNVDESMI